MFLNIGLWIHANLHRSLNRFFIYKMVPCVVIKGFNNRLFIWKLLFFSLTVRRLTGEEPCRKLSSCSSVSTFIFIFHTLNYLSSILLYSEISCESLPEGRQVSPSIILCMWRELDWRAVECSALHDRGAAHCITGAAHCMAGVRCTWESIVSAPHPKCASPDKRQKACSSQLPPVPNNKFCFNCI